MASYQPRQRQQEVSRVGGLIIFRCPDNNGVHADFEYLLLKKHEINDWSPPKGKMNFGESEIKTAKRETKEETGLIEDRDYELLNSYKIYFTYTTPSKILKKVTLWPARLHSCSKVICLSKEHEKFQWFKMNEAVNIIKTDYKPALEEAIRFII